MFHRFACRGTAALMLVLALALVGAKPAAAQEDRFHAAQATTHAVIEWLTGLWQAATAGTGATATPNGDRGAGLDPNGFADRGAGLDPNGALLPTGPGSAP